VSLVPAVVELRVDGRVDGRGGRLLDMLVAQKLGGELRLGLGHTGPCAAVDGVNLGDHQHIGHRHRGKTEGHQQQHVQEAASDAFDTQLQWIGKTGHLNRTIYMPPNTISRLNYCVRPQIFGF